MYSFIIFFSSLIPIFLYFQGWYYFVEAYLIMKENYIYNQTFNYDFIDDVNMSLNNNSCSDFINGVINLE